MNALRIILTIAIFFAVICFTKVFIYTGVAMEHRWIVYFVINNMNQSEICAHCIRFFVSRYGTCAQYRDVLLFVRSAHRERKKNIILTLGIHTHNYHWSHPHCDFNSFQRNKSISHSDFFLSFLSLFFLHFTYVCIFQLQRNHFKQIETRIQRIIRSGSHSLFCVFVGEL